MKSKLFYLLILLSPLALFANTGDPPKKEEPTITYALVIGEQAGEFKEFEAEEVFILTDDLMTYQVGIANYLSSYQNLIDRQESLTSNNNYLNSLFANVTDDLPLKVAWYYTLPHFYTTFQQNTTKQPCQLPGINYPLLC